MIRKLYIIAIISVVLPALSSCRAISSFLGSDDVVAVVGSDKLYREDIESLIPKGLSSEDSLRLASQYINSWASDRVYLKIAEEQLSKSEKDVTKELEEYRRSLLKYIYLMKVYHTKVCDWQEKLETHIYWCNREQIRF